MLLWGGTEAARSVVGLRLRLNRHEKVRTPQSERLSVTCFSPGGSQKWLTRSGDSSFARQAGRLDMSRQQAFKHTQTILKLSFSGLVSGVGCASGCAARCSASFRSISWWNSCLRWHSLERLFVKSPRAAHASSGCAHPVGAHPWVLAGLARRFSLCAYVHIPGA